MAKSIPLEPGTVCRFVPANCAWWNDKNHAYLRELGCFIAEDGTLEESFPNSSPGRMWLHVKGIRRLDGTPVRVEACSGWGFAPGAFVIDEFLTAVHRAKLCQNKTNSKPEM